MGVVFVHAQDIPEVNNREGRIVLIGLRHNSAGRMAAGGILPDRLSDHIRLSTQRGTALNKYEPLCFLYDPDKLFDNTLRFPHVHTSSRKFQKLQVIRDNIWLTPTDHSTL
jgi:hypothetical protein